MSIVLRNISYTYSKGTPLAKPGLTNIDLQIEDGEWVIVMGPTGSGKSTLLQHLNGLLKPDTGSVLIDNINIHSSSATLREARQKVGFIFQYPEHQLFGSTIFEEISYGPENFGYPRSDVEKKVKEAMDLVGLDFVKYKDRSSYRLSGGEKRRVALAGALAANPRIVALDEPTAGMDLAGKQMIIKTVTQLNRNFGVTIIWVTHEITEIAELVNRVFVLDSGRLVAEGTVRVMLASQLLMKYGLDVPVAVAVANGLRKKGKYVEGQPITVEEIKREIIRLMK